MPRKVKLAARAFDDAVRDILRADGRFSLADANEPSLVWQFDGCRWTPLALRSGRTPERAASEHSAPL
jgi:hypothetical protein